jgi:hypothetical protein
MEKGGERLKKKILIMAFALMFVAMLATPVLAAKPTYPDIMYTKVRVGSMALVRMMIPTGESHIWQILRTEQSGLIYEGNVTGVADPGDPAYNYTAIGKMMYNRKQSRQVWHFDYVWTVIGDENSGFKGRVNGQAIDSTRFIVTGILQGFGALKGQKLVVEVERMLPYAGPGAGVAVFTGKQTR